MLVANVDHECESQNVSRIMESQNVGRECELRNGVANGSREMGSQKLKKFGGVCSGNHEGSN